MPKGIIPPPPRPGGPGAKSDPGPRAGGDLPGCVRPSRAGQDSAPELLRGAGSGRRGAPGGGGRGWSGLAVRGPGRALGPGSYPGFLAPSSPPQDYTGPTSSCALIWILGRNSGGLPRPQSNSRTPACCLGDGGPAPRLHPPTPEGQWNSPRAARLSSRGRLQAEPLLDGGEQTVTGGVCSWAVTSSGVACPGSSSQEQNWQGPGQGAPSCRLRMTRQGRALSPSGLLPHFLPRLSFLSLFLRKGVGLGDRAPAIPPVGSPRAGRVSGEPRVTKGGLWA